MHDQITKLCHELVWASDPDDLHPVWEQLQGALPDRLERVRDNDGDVVRMNVVVDLESVIAGTVAEKEQHDSSSQRSSA